jgi:SRSO17 transposase
LAARQRARTLGTKRRVLTDGQRQTRAGRIPPEARTLTSKSEHALDIVRQARGRGMRFEWVGVDAGYGKEPAFLRALDEMNEVFVADVHRTQRIGTDSQNLRFRHPSRAACVRRASGRPRWKRSRWKA